MGHPYASGLKRLLGPCGGLPAYLLDAARGDSPPGWSLRALKSQLLAYPDNRRIQKS